MTTVTTLNTTDAHAMDVHAFAAQEVIPEALIIQTSTRAGVVEGDAPAVLVPFIDADDDAGFVAEGAAITEGSPDSSEVVIHTGKVAVLAKVSREQYNQQGAANLLSTAVRRAVIKKADAAYLAQAAPSSPAVTPPAGLLNLNPTDGGTVSPVGWDSANLDSLTDAVMDIEKSFGHASHIIANPDVWARLMKFKRAANSNEALLGAGTSDAERRLLSIPVLVAAALPADKLLVVDSNSILSAYGDVQLAVSDQVYFASDSIGIRCTFRFGAKIVDTARVVKLTIEEPEPEEE